MAVKENSDKLLLCGHKFVLSAHKRVQGYWDITEIVRSGFDILQK